MPYTKTLNDPKKVGEALGIAWSTGSYNNRDGFGREQK